MGNGTDFSAELFGSTPQRPTSGRDYSADLFAPQGKSLEGLKENLARNLGEIYTGVLALPETVQHLGRGAYYAVTDAKVPTDILPSEAATMVSEKQMAQQLPGRVYEGAKRMATEAYQHPEQIPGKVYNWAYENPADVLSLAAVPAAKALTTAGTALRGAEASRIAAGGTGLYTKGLGLAAQAAETGAKVAPWLDPMRPAEGVAKYTAKKAGAAVNRLRSIVDPKTGEMMRVLGPTQGDVLRELVTAGEVPTVPFVHTGPQAAHAAEEAASTGLVPMGVDTIPAGRKGLTVGEKLVRTRPKPSSGQPRPAATEAAEEVAESTGRGAVNVEGIPYAEGYEDVFAPFRGAGEVASNAGPGGRIYAAMQKKASVYTPETNRAYLGQQMERDALRKQLVGDASGSPEEIAALAEQAKRVGDVPYDAARTVNRPIDLQPVVDIVDNIALNNPKNRDLVSVLDRVKRNMFDDMGKGMIETDPTIVASIIDDLKGQIGKRENAHIKKSLVEVKDALFAQFPEYAQADVLYKQGWAPAHQKQVASYLQNILEKKGSKAFAEAYDNMPLTIQRATGQKLFKSYEPIFEGSEDTLQKLRSVRDDVVSELNYEAAAADPYARAAARDLFEPELISSPGLLNAVYTMGRWLVKRAQGRMSEAAATKMALEMLNPKTAIPALERSITKTGQAERFGALTQKGIKSGLRPGVAPLYHGVGLLADQYGVLQNDALQGMANQYGLAPAGRYEDTGGYVPTDVSGQPEASPSINDMADRYGLDTEE